MKHYLLPTGLLLLLSALAMRQDLYAQVPISPSVRQLPSSGSGIVENRGQLHDQDGIRRDDILYYTNASNTSVHFKAASFSYEMHATASETDWIEKAAASKELKEPTSDDFVIRSHRVDVSFVNAAVPVITVQELLPAYSNHYQYGTTIDGITNVRRWKSIVYHNIYRNIDVAFSSTDNSQDGVKYDIVLNPGADISDFKMRFEGATSIEQIAANKIKIKTSIGEITECIPLCWCLNDDGTMTCLESAFMLTGNEIAFSISGFKCDRTTILDPSVLWGTYFGGGGEEFGHNINLDGKGNLYITGRTTSANLIATKGAYQTQFAGDWDAYLAKFDIFGALEWSTYYGSVGFDNFIPVAFIDTNVIVGGTTSSVTGIATPGAYQLYNGGHRDNMLVCFSETGIRKWCTYYGGDGEDIPYGIVIDTVGAIYLTGTTGSFNRIATLGAYQTSYGGGVKDAYLASFTPNGFLVWATYLGGSGYEEGNSLCMSKNGSIILAGETSSDRRIASTGSHQSDYGGGESDAYLAAFSRTGTHIWTTYMGGASTDRSYYVAVDANNDILTTGITSSSNGISTMGTHQADLAGDYDAWLAKYDISGNLIWSTYYGGPFEDVGYGVEVTPENNIILAGYTFSPSGIATPDGFVTTKQGVSDIFVTKFTTNGRRIWGSYLGGTGHDICKAIKSGSNGVYYLVGNTTSSTGISTPGTHQTSYSGAGDALVVAINENELPFPDITAGADFSLCFGSSGVIEGSASGGLPPYTVKWSPSTGLSDPTSLTPTASPTVTTTYTLIVTDAAMQSVKSKVTITVLPAPIANAGADKTIPSGGSTQIGLPAAGGRPPYTYSWVPPTGLSNTDVESPTASPAVTTTYQLTVTDSTGCASQDEVVVYVTGPTVPSITYNGKAVICSGDSLILYATAGFRSYEWSPGLQSTRSITVKQSGSYYVTAVDNQGNTRQSQPVQVTVNPRPVVSVTPSGPLSFCEGKSVTLDAGMHDSYRWSTGDIGRSIVVRQSGTYTVIVQNEYGCPAESSPIVVTVTPIPVAITADGPLTLCQGASVNLDAGPGYSTYLWSTGATTRRISAAQPGTYYVTVSDSLGCMGTSPVITITVAASLQPTITANKALPFCEGDSISLDAGPGYAAYLWSTGQTTQRINVYSAGIYTVTVTSSYGCSGTSAPFTVDVTTAPVITPSDSVKICIGSPLTLDAGAGYSSYSWSTGETTQTIVVKQSGLYTVTVTIGPCTLTSAAVRVIAESLLVPVVTASGSISFCEGDSVVLATEPGYMTYHWSTGEATRSITVRKSGSYTVAVQDPGGCIGLSVPISVTVYAAPTPVITPSDGTICEGDSVILDAGAGYVKYEWSDGSSERHLTIRSTGTYRVKVTDAFGCTGTSPDASFTVLPRPSKPTITRNGSVLLASQASRYQWYKNGIPMPGETNQFLLVTDNGIYTVEVFSDGSICGAMSDATEMIVSVEAVPEAAGIELYPDPHNGVFTLQLNCCAGMNTHVCVTDMLGRIVYTAIIQPVSIDHSMIIDISSQPVGMYMVYISAGLKTYMRQAVKR